MMITITDTAITEKQVSVRKNVKQVFKKSLKRKEKAVAFRIRKAINKLYAIYLISLLKRYHKSEQEINAVLSFYGVYGRKPKE